MFSGKNTKDGTTKVSKQMMADPATDWIKLSDEDAERVHHAAFQVFRHRSGHHMALLWFGIMEDLNSPRWVWRLLYPMNGLCPEFQGCPTTVPYGWAGALLMGAKPKVTQP